MDNRLSWFKSSYSSGNGQCVLCARLPDGGMAVQDSKRPASPVLTFTSAEWQAFTAGVRAGEFDLA